ncbi:Gfo/Idh/MocA family protein [Belliella marina]|uniref:Gfo/Idh/MocA family protein n=1 Tax=Belliella marina TaxID=1644146 RepID=A0ABW4VP19_9BACT
MKESAICIIGAGGIVRDAHLPAYGLAGYQVAGITDLNLNLAEDLATKHQINLFKSLSEMVEKFGDKVIYDIAVPGDAVMAVLQQIPDGSHVLIQKPMGNNWQQANEILNLCRKKKLVAGINFQLRYAPNIQKARALIDLGKIGDLCEIEVNIDVYTPWHLWKFLYELPRVEILYHSIHYIDMVRSFVGNPKRIFAKTTKHPKMADLASVRSNIIMDYGDWMTANIRTNHAHDFGIKNQQSYIKFEGTEGAIKLGIGLLKDYPIGVADSFEWISKIDPVANEWKEEKIEGVWFPHAFIGSMAEIQKAVKDPNYQPDNSVEDCIHTMACVEAAYDSSQFGGKVFSEYNL